LFSAEADLTGFFHTALLQISLREQRWNTAKKIGKGNKGGCQHHDLILLFEVLFFKGTVIVFC
jgi:hypothetical protein